MLEIRHQLEKRRDNLNSNRLNSEHLGNGIVLLKDIVSHIITIKHPSV